MNAEREDGQQQPAAQPASASGSVDETQPETAPDDVQEDEGTEALRRERDEYRDLLLRKTAEFENYRKRIDKERRQMAQFAASDLLEALLPIVDDFERALEVEAGPEADAYRKGVELIYKRLQEFLAARGVTPIEAAGHDFDPLFHQAMTYEESAGHRDGEVIEEVRRGYMHGERLLRPAMVKVAKA